MLYLDLILVFSPTLMDCSLCSMPTIECCTLHSLKKHPCETIEPSICNSRIHSERVRIDDIINHQLKTTVINRFKNHNSALINIGRWQESWKCEEGCPWDRKNWKLRRLLNNRIKRYDLDSTKVNKKGQ